VINPSLNTVPYTFALLANISAFQNQTVSALDGEILWQKIIMLLEHFDTRQVRYVGSEFSQIVTAAANLARRAQQVCVFLLLGCRDRS
jgi:COP9 signalosome complex subunit 3